MLKVLSAIIAFFLLQTCGSKLLTPVCEGAQINYKSHVAVILENSCNTSFCHGSGSKNGDWTTYAKLEEILVNGKFEKSVLIEQTMPKNLTRLNQEEINILQCWMEQGFPEN